MGDGDGELRKKIMAIQSNPELTPQQKGHAMQALMSSKWDAANGSGAQENASPNKKEKKDNGILDEDALKCVFCSELCTRPVTAPCQHNFCLECFGKWVAKGNKACPTCRAKLPPAFTANPRINTALTIAIRMARQGDRPTKAEVARIANHDKPDEAYTSERAVRAGRANACSGKILVTIPGDHFGPIGPESDPVEGKGVYVGRWWNDRMDCRQWGAHFPHVAGISGQSKRGAQSVVLSGGYEDDKDEGEWFLYTGSGGRDLSGNKRTSKVQSFDQTFDKMNLALKLSCTKGLPVRVIRSYKEKRSAYAPPTETPVRYDGIYRIAACWRKPGAQGQLMCRYLFVRCDNEPAPWSSDTMGDQPTTKLPGAALAEMKAAQGPVFKMDEASPFWGWSEKESMWKWLRPAPPSALSSSDDGGPCKGKRKQASQSERALKEFSCGVCKGVLQQPLVMPCGHKFCKPCLLAKFEGMGDLEENNHGRATRPRAIKKPCPSCAVDCAPFLKNAQVNTEMVSIIERLQATLRKEQEAAAAGSDSGEGSEGAAAGEETPAGNSNEAVSPTSPAENTAVAGHPSTLPAGKKVPLKLVSVTAVAAAEQPAAGPPPAPQPASAPAPTEPSKADVLAADFPGFDRELIAGMLDDQGGDERDVRLVLDKMKNAMLAAERKAVKASRAAARNGTASSTPSKAAAKTVPKSTTVSKAAKRNTASSPSAKKAAASAAAAGKEAMVSPTASPAKRQRSLAGNL